jgi:hypothetical protein
MLQKLLQRGLTSLRIFYKMIFCKNNGMALKITSKIDENKDRK